MYHSQGTGQASNTEKEQTFWQKEKVHQTWGNAMVQKQGKKALMVPSGMVNIVWSPLF